MALTPSTMLELGTRSEELHTLLLDEASSLGLHLVVATGEFARAAAKAGSTETGGPAARILSGMDPLEAYKELRGRLTGDEVLLMKASRSVALERLIPLFESDFGDSAADSGGGEA